MTFTELRKAKGYRSARELGDAIGIKGATVAKWDKGKARPRYETALIIAKLFQMTVEEIMATIRKAG